MKKIVLTTTLIFIAAVTYSDWDITRGPNPGEIYFRGITYSGEVGLYYSTDYGQTAQCMDSTFYQAVRITADKTAGVVYYVTMQEGLFISYDYGSQGTWQYRNSGIKLQINSGLVEGQIYSSFSKHSDDYGFNFINHSYNGFFGSKLDVEIDNEPGVGYVLVNQYGINDSLFLLKSTDNFENLELQFSFYLETNTGSVRRLSRGIYDGELFFLNGIEGRLLVTQDYGASWIETNKYNYSEIFIKDLVGGRIEGEVYTLYSWSNLMGQNAHTYILYSTDYGITYEVYHPFAKGIEPLLSQFSAKTEDDATGGVDIKTIDSVYFVTGDMPLNVQFYNYSIGDINSYEWDFNSDGIVDSYEENPIYTYADTGWYSVSLTIYDNYDSNSFLREDYIYVYELTNVVEPQPEQQNEIFCFPNPFSEKLTITFTSRKIENPGFVFIYDITGAVINKLEFERNSPQDSFKTTWNGIDKNGNKVKPGIYFIKIDDTAFKVVLTE